MTALRVDLSLNFALTDEQFQLVCQQNQDLQFERTPTGELVIMRATGSETGRKNMTISAQLWLWNQSKGLGVVFDSSTAFTLPNKAIRSPDASWIKQERWDSLSLAEKSKFARICPDFVIELCSPTDQPERLRDKMKEYVENGVKLGWLIFPNSQMVEVYKPLESVQYLQQLPRVSGEDILPDFVLDLTEVW